MFRMLAPANVTVLIRGIILASLMSQTIFAQAPASKGQVTPAVTSSPQKTTGAPTRYRPNRVSKRETAYYESVWGVDSLSVRAVESGELIRFTYQVVDPDKSKLLNDKKLEPALIFPEGHVKLIIPSLEKVGQLRQSSTPEAGRSYWMAFSNPQRTVKRGDRVDVVIGSFHAEGLIVE
jgi:hypothetical protein